MSTERQYSTILQHKEEKKRKEKASRSHSRRPGETRTLNSEGNPRRVLAVRVERLACVLSLISWLHGGEGQHAASHHGSGTHPVPWTAWEGRSRLTSLAISPLNHTWKSWKDTLISYRSIRWRGLAFRSPSSGTLPAGPAGR